MYFIHVNVFEPNTVDSWLYMCYNKDRKVKHAISLCDLLTQIFLTFGERICLKKFQIYMKSTEKECFQNT